MPSPFPGMDPFLEDQAWKDFHHEVISVIRESLTQHVVPRYVVRVDERVYLEHQPEERPGVIEPDVIVLEPQGPSLPSRGGAATATVVAITRVTLTVPMPERQREAFLTVRLRETMDVVTVIEVLSPTNKRAGSDGRKEYLKKREEVLLSSAHLVELDLLRGGARLPTNEPLPPGDYYALVCRRRRRPRVEVYAWPLRHPLPTIPVPLTGEDPDVALDLQEVFTTVYDRAAYQYSIDYAAVVEPPLPEADAAWARELLKNAGDA
jgi:hypothetical protein